MAPPRSTKDSRSPAAGPTDEAKEEQAALAIASDEGRPTVLFVSHTGMWGGGAEVVLGQMLRAAREAGYHTGLAAPRGEMLDRLGACCDSVYPVPIIPPRRTRDLGRLAFLLFATARSAWQIGRAVQDVRASIVHANSGAAALVALPAAVVLRRRLIWHQHDIIPRRLVNRLVLAPTGVLSARVVGCSWAVAESLRRVGIPQRRISVLHNAVRSSFFEQVYVPAEARSELKLPEDVPLAVMAGRLVPYKRHLDFLDALGHLRVEGLPAHAAIAGEAPRLDAGDLDSTGDYPNVVRQRARQPDVAGAVTFLGPVADLRLLLAAGDVMVVPSRDEPFALVALEAMAAGTPIIASDSGGHPEAIENGVSGLLFPTGDIRSLSNALRMALTDPRLRQKMADNARRRAQERFSEAGFRSNLAGIYSAVLGRLPLAHPVGGEPAP